MYWKLSLNSLVLSCLAAGVTIILGMVLANGLRLRNEGFARFVVRLATMGYAVPGPVIGIGALVVLSTFDHGVNNLFERWFNMTIGLILIGSVVGLIYGYVVRFMTKAYNSVESSLVKVTPNITMAAKTLGATSWRLSWYIHIPLLAPGMFVGAILIFVDAMKELPITMILRPFGYDTLALWVWQMAAESLWGGAALPALTIVAVGVIPVILLMRAATPNRDGYKI